MINGKKNTTPKNTVGWTSFFSTMHPFLPHIQKQSRQLVLSLFASLGYVLCGMLEPWPLKMVFDNVFSQKKLPTLFQPIFSPYLDDKLTLLNVLILSIIIIAVIRGVFYYYQQIFTSSAAQQVISGIRLDLYKHLQSLPFSFHDRRKTGDMLSRLTADMRILRDVLTTLPLTVTSELLLMIALVVVMAFMDWQLTLLSLCSIPLLFFLVKRYRQPMKKEMRNQREREGHLANLASEVLNAIKVVQGYHQETYEVDRFDSHNSKTLKTGVKATRLEAKLRWGSELAVAIVTAVVIGVAGRRVMSGILSPGDLLVFTFYLRMFNRPLRRVSKMAELMARGAASFERVLSLISIEPKIKDIPGAAVAKEFCGEIQYQDVSFDYKDGEQVLHNINLTINPGEKVAIVGHTGSGKSTLVSLLPRFYEPTRGCVTIDGVDISSYTLKSLRQQISIVFQEPILFATSIAENISYGRPDATRDEIVDAAKRAQIHRIIETLPDGYDTVLGERGGTLSGGQRQCVAIARSIIKNAPIIILDEPTSGLDMPSALLVMEALKALIEDKTVLIISHQRETLCGVDRIIEMKKGRLITPALV